MRPSPWVSVAFRLAPRPRNMTHTAQIGFCRGGEGLGEWGDFLSNFDICSPFVLGFVILDTITPGPKDPHKPVEEPRLLIDRERT
jgi:hypothetical protein